MHEMAQDLGFRVFFASDKTHSFNKRFRLGHHIHLVCHSAQMFPLLCGMGWLHGSPYFGKLAEELEVSLRQSRYLLAGAGGRRALKLESGSIPLRVLADQLRGNLAGRHHFVVCLAGTPELKYEAPYLHIAPRTTLHLDTPNVMRHLPAENPAFSKSSACTDSAAARPGLHQFPRTAARTF